MTTIDMFFEDSAKLWSDAHVIALRRMWKDMHNHKLFTYNREWYAKIFKNASDATLTYYAGLDIPHFSDWAKDEQKGREITSYQ